MYISAKAHVIGEIPSDVIRIRIEHDIVTVPEPVITIGVVEEADGKDEAADEEPPAIAALHPPHMFWAQGTGKVTVFPWMLETVMRIVPPRVMSNPTIVVCLDMGRHRVSPLVAPRGLRVRRTVIRGRPMRGNMATL